MTISAYAMTESGLQTNLFFIFQTRYHESPITTSDFRFDFQRVNMCLH